MNIFGKLSNMNLNRSVDLTLRYGGEAGVIDARTLGTSLLGFARIIEGVNDGLYTGKRIQIEVTSTGIGSFDIGIKLIEGLLASGANLLTDHDKYELSGIVTAAIIGMKVRTAFGKRKPEVVNEDDHNITIKNHKGNIYIFEKGPYYATTHGANVTLGLDQFFGALLADHGVPDISVIADDKSILFKADREDIENAGEPIRGDEDHEEKFVTDHVSLTIVKPSFDKSRKWDFILNGYSISALVGDQDFNNRVNTRKESFGAGDLLEVDLRTKKVWDGTFNTFVNREFVVVKVYDHRVSERAVVQSAIDNSMEAAIAVDFPKKKKRKK